MAITIAFVPAGTNPGMPPSAINLPELGAVDTGQAPPTTIDPSGPAPVESGATTTLPSGDAATGATTTIAGPTTTAGG